MTSRCTMALVLALMLAGGCGITTGPRPQPERDASALTGVTDPIVFGVEAEPVDLAEPAGEVLTLEQVLRLVLRHDPRLQAALARVRASEAEARQTRLLPNPILSVAVRYPEGGGTPTIDAGLSADLVALLGRAGRISAADHRLRAASAEVLATVLDVVQEVQERYAAAQTLGELMPVLDARRQLLVRLLETARARLRAGEGTQLDVLTLQSQLVQLELEIAQKQLERREELLALARLIGQPSADPSWQVSRWHAPPLPAHGEGVWMSAGLAHRPEVQARHWELAALGEDLSSARWLAWEGAEAGVDAEKEEDWSVGPAVSAPIPLLDWGQARRARVRAQKIEARHQLTQTRRQVIEEVRRAHAAFASVTGTLERARTQLVPLAQQRLQQAESQYLAGQTDITALVLAEQDLQEARASVIELERQASMALSRLQRAVGGPGVAASLKAVPAPVAATRPQNPPERPTEMDVP